MLDLTIAIPVKNEEKNLGGCLEAIGRGLVRKIVIIDSGSTDNTKAIAKEFGADVLDFYWDGKFPKKRNWFLRNHTPKTTWVLFLDADEYLTADFKADLKDALTANSDKNGIYGFWLNYSIYFLGKKLKGGYPLTKLALFRVGAGEYEKIDENQWSKMDMEIHEHPILKGKISNIKSKIDHRDFRGIDSYVDKHNQYAAWEAARFSQILNDADLSNQFTWKQRIKYRMIHSIWIGPLFFIGSYIFMGGFRDGSRGFAFAILKMSYFTQIYCRLRELKQKEENRLI
ncbi:glycosyltransferase family 2 protein [Cryomorpha ignava]|uniref:Glycosyltransferase family 2 protein n=1 Tax=Cryomorpha ignava TaxID=101383 RepID=A0A7K3WKS4_9FLAO|nr:glycosyltransferase family 2 protein [Cryomorpha ignava]NEN22247.1 glycosyltransferase family 2 protein [Cryomorpha ignava]